MVAKYIILSKFDTFRSFLYCLPLFRKQEVAIRIGILTTHLTDEEDRFLEAGKNLDCDVEILEVRKFGISICPDNPKIYYEGQRITGEFDAIIPRIDPPHTEFGFMVLRQFQALDVYVTDTAYSLELCRDKLRCLQYLMRKNVPFPTTGSAYSRVGYDKIIKTVGGAPLIIKLNEGTEGIGVFLAEDEKAAKNFLQTFKQFDVRVMLQEFIKESSGRDIRAVVLGGKVIGSFERTSQDGDFRANTALGGAVKVIEITEEEKNIALHATEAMKLNMAGVDIIRSKNGPLIIEINSAQDFAGPYGVEALYDINFAGMILNFAIEGKKKFDKGEGVWLQKNPLKA